MSSVKAFGAIGDGKADDTQAILHAISDGDGFIRFPKGMYRISRTIEINLSNLSQFAIEGTGGLATIIMEGEGPALRFVGTHTGTGDPNTVHDNIWKNERMPTVRNIEISSTNPSADGVELIKTMQPIFEGVLIRKVRNGISLRQRNRNVLISDSHIYHNTGVGVLIEDCNLHQINIAGNHISYNRLGGIRIERSEVRNLQISGNDIEYNNHDKFGAQPEPAAEIYVDTTADGASVNEVAIASNTIQATASPGGANIRILENPDTSRPPGLWTITGNIIGSQENNVHLTGCHGIVISGNCIYSCSNRNLLVEKSTQINVIGNNFRRHTPQYGTGVRFVKSQDCVINACIVKDESEEGQSSAASLLELENCKRINIQGCQFLDGSPFGVDVKDSSDVNIVACTCVEQRRQGQANGAIRFRGAGQRNSISSSTVCSSAKSLQIDSASDVSTANVISYGTQETG